jgi:hypothetical protein
MAVTLHGHLHGTESSWHRTNILDLMSFATFERIIRLEDELDRSYVMAQEICRSLRNLDPKSDGGTILHGAMLYCRIHFSQRAYRDWAF